MRRAGPGSFAQAGDAERAAALRDGDLDAAPITSVERLLLPDGPPAAVLGIDADP